MVYTCQRCGVSGTKEERVWYQSEQSGEVICQSCYFFLKQLESEKDELISQQQLILEAKKKVEKSWLKRFHDSAYRNLMIFLMVMVFSLAAFLGGLYLVGLDAEDTVDQNEFYGFWRNDEVNDTGFFGVVFTKDGRLVVYNTSDEYMLGHYILNQTHVFGYYHDTSGAILVNHTLLSAYRLKRDGLRLGNHTFSKFEELP